MYSENMGFGYRRRKNGSSFLPYKFFVIFYFLEQKTVFWKRGTNTLFIYIPSLFPFNFLWLEFSEDKHSLWYLINSIGKWSFPIKHVSVYLLTNGKNACKIERKMQNWSCLSICFFFFKKRRDKKGM